MANVVPFSFAQELLKGIITFKASGSNTIKLALYTANPYTTASTQYTSGSANQVSTTGGTNNWWKHFEQSGSCKSNKCCNFNF